MAFKLKRKSRATFARVEDFNSTSTDSCSLFNSDNLIRVYNIFVNDSAELDVRKNAAEQLALMLNTGDGRLHKTFIEIDGFNYCVRYLRQSLLSRHLGFLDSLCDSDSLTRMQSSCLNCICQVLYSCKELRQSYLFDVEFYRLIFKCLFISYSYLLLQNEPKEQEEQRYYNDSNAHQDSASILFMMLFHQVASLQGHHHENESSSIKNRINSVNFELNSNLRQFIQEPFVCASSHTSNSTATSVEHCEQENEQFKIYEIAYKLNASIKRKCESVLTQTGSSVIPSAAVANNELILKQIINKRLRLYWNIRWHGGSLEKLCEDLINNENLIETQQTGCNKNFSQHLCMSENDKQLAKYTHPCYLFKQLCSKLTHSSTHAQALVTLDLLQMLVSMSGLCISPNVNTYVGDLSALNNLFHYFDRLKCDWHISLNRFVGLMPSSKSKSDQSLFSNSFLTIAKMLRLQTACIQRSKQLASSLISSSLSTTNFSENNELVLLSDITVNQDLTTLLSINKWLTNFVYNASSTLLLMIKQFLDDYESDELRINSHMHALCEFIDAYYESLSNDEDLLLSQWPIESRLPSLELLQICVQQIQSGGEADKNFRNLHKLTILVNLISGTLRAGVNSSINCGADQIYASQQSQHSTLLAEFHSKNTKLFMQLIKSLVQVI
jgi:hypothetical protein